jgi:hypothetical protein
VRTTVLAIALAFIGVLLALTIHAAVQGGVDVLTALSALVLVLLGVGIVGALGHPPQE